MAFKITARLLLQIDLENHSSWYASADSLPEATEARADLADRLKKALQRLGFDLLSWKGDGGVYIAPPERGNGNWDFAVDAAVAASKEFGRWRSASGDRAALRMRMSLHYAPDVFAHKNLGYWASETLNSFIKHERDIGVSGTLAVSDVVFRHLTPRAQSRFSVSRVRRLAGMSTVHYAALAEEALANRENGLGFFEWLSRQNLPCVCWSDPYIGPAESFRVSVHESSVLAAAPQPDSPLSTSFFRTNSDAELHLTKAEEAAWTERQQAISNQSMRSGRGDEKKVSVHRISRPLIDIPLVDMEYEIETWSRARSFHRLLEDNPSLLMRISPQALAILDDGSAVPGIACCHMVVQTADQIDGVRTLLAAQRQTKGVENIYSPGNWSISCEEQMRPGEDVEACARRGMAEELLGSHADVGLSFRVLGLILERKILNIAIIVLVDVPLTFDEIVNSWKLSVDKDEHRQLAHFKPTSTMLSLLAGGAGVIPEAARVLLTPSHPATFEGTTDWLIHPTSLARLSFATWAQSSIKI